MSEPEFKLYEEEYLDVSKQIEQLNKELNDLKELIKSFSDVCSEHTPLINELEEELINLKNSIEKTKETLERAEEYRNTERKYSALISGSLGSLTGGTIGMLLVPFIGPTTPLITTLVGGFTGVVYSLRE